MRHLNDISSLYSCILVNRTWCRIAIPLLWEDPFSLRDYSIIDYYLYNLSENDKIKLKERGINSDLFPSNTLFNYPSFIKCLNTWDLHHSIDYWVADKQNNSILDLNLLYSTRLVYKLLFKLFIENEATLHTFKIEIIMERNHEFFNDVIELILQNPNFIHNVKNFMFSISYKNVNDLTEINSLLSLLTSNINSFSTIYFQFGKLDTIIKHISFMINSQKNLKKILFRSSNYPLYDSLLSLKNSNCSNTLKMITFYQINFSNISIFKEVFDHLNVMESIHMIYCRFFNSDFIQQINILNKPFKLRSLYILDNTYQIDSIQLLLQKSGVYLENFGFEFECHEIKQVLKSITEYCTKVRFLAFPGFIDQKIYSAFDIIKNIGQTLNYLDITFHGMYIDYYSDELIEISLIILKNLGQFLPFRLEYLHLFLYGTIAASDFELFLKNSQNTFIKKLLINNLIEAENEDILPNLLDKYIVKKRRVRYLGFLNNLFHLQEEYKYYNVIVKDYGDLVYGEFYDCINERY
ncbi:hypothetical protein RclHR1_05910003 [Rhizophagus clarus]|nr:hypothetical protein RclHR1_05910003 [Rhizophagus clarus]